ncbi:MAG TPA: DUF1700 domain-containing protein [Ruminococcus sp.]
MNKQEFLAELRKGLHGLPQNDIEERLTFYNEMIDDRMEEGLTEDAAVSEVGTVNEVISQIVTETPLSKIVKEKVRPKRTLRVWEIVLLALGSPIWLSLLIAAFAVIFAVYVTAWSVIAALWASELALAVSSIGSILSAVIFAFQVNGIVAIAVLGAGIAFAGLSIFLFFGCKETTKGILFLTKKMILGIKSLFIGKENIK